MKTSDRLRALLRAAGFEVATLRSVSGFYRQVENVSRWEAFGVEIATGHEVHIESYSTMTACCQQGIHWSRAADAHDTDSNIAVYAGTAQQDGKDGGA